MEDRLKEYLTDSVTTELFENPMVLSSGITVSNDTYLKLLQNGMACPLTRKVLDSSATPNIAIETLVNAFKDGDFNDSDTVRLLNAKIEELEKQLKKKDEVVRNLEGIYYEADRENEANKAAVKALQEENRKLRLQINTDDLVHPVTAQRRTRNYLVMQHKLRDMEKEQVGLDNAKYELTNEKEKLQAQVDSLQRKLLEANIRLESVTHRRDVNLFCNALVHSGRTVDGLRQELHLSNRTILRLREELEQARMQTQVQARRVQEYRRFQTNVLSR